MERVEQGVASEAGALAGAPAAQDALVLSVIVLPAAGAVVGGLLDAASLQRCLDSLIAQSEPGWLLGTHWELLVVDGQDDVAGAPGSSTVLPAANTPTLTPRTPLPKGWTEANNERWTGAEQARGQWLLFTSANTVHLPGTLSRAVVEAQRHGAGLLSYKPRDRATGLLARALLPLVSSELATAYPLPQVNEPGKRIAYADEAYLLLQSSAYRELGGWESFAPSLVSAVDLAFLAKQRKVALRVRYAPEVVERHWRSLGELWQAQTATLALLINNALALSVWRLLDVVLVWGLPLLAWLYPAPQAWVPWVILLIWLRTLLRVYRRAARSQAPTGEVLLSLVLGLPIFAVLLYGSWYRVRVLRRVRLGRHEYPVKRA